VCQFTDENCTIFKTEQNDITNEKGIILTFGENSSIMWKKTCVCAGKKGTNRNYKLSNPQN